MTGLPPVPPTGQPTTPPAGSHAPRHPSSNAEKTGAEKARRPAGDLRPAPRPPELANPALEEGQPAGWDWSAQTDTGAALLVAHLEAFVAYLNGRYAWTREQTIPPCWASHGALIEEITTLMWSRWAAFQGPLAGPEAAQTWHTYHLPLFTARITTWIGHEAAADCRSGHHQPSRLVDPDRPVVTGRRSAPAIQRP